MSNEHINTNKKDKTNKRKLEDIDEEINILKNEIKTNKRKLIKLEKQIVTSDEKHESNVDMLFEKTSNYEDKFNNLHNDIKILNEKLDSHRKLESKKELDCNNNQSISKRPNRNPKGKPNKGVIIFKGKARKHREDFNDEEAYYTTDNSDIGDSDDSEISTSSNESGCSSINSYSSNENSKQDNNDKNTLKKALISSENHVNRLIYNIIVNFNTTNDYHDFNSKNFAKDGIASKAFTRRVETIIKDYNKLLENEKKQLMIQLCY